MFYEVSDANRNTTQNNLDWAESVEVLALCGHSAGHLPLRRQVGKPDNASAEDGEQY
jgi:hypothetical protein